MTLRTLLRPVLAGLLLASALSCASETESSADPARVSPPMPTHKIARRARPSDDVLRKELTPMQFDVTRNDGTEPPFHNEFFDNHKPGIYVEIITGEPLFSSNDKFESGTGWPSFTRPIAPDALQKKDDKTGGMDREEVRSRQGDSHLGHVFDDGPAPTGLRYCIDSAALRFIPADQLTAAGYPEYVASFAGKK